ncbi:hypothetical protein J6590_105644 [Homalodisca vitripennis]|nr:hypothetical protein J6590_105644 [Homalodisca vitripennis]
MEQNKGLQNSSCNSKEGKQKSKCLIITNMVLKKFNIPDFDPIILQVKTTEESSKIVNLSETMSSPVVIIQEGEDMLYNSQSSDDVMGYLYTQICVTKYKFPKSIIVVNSIIRNRIFPHNLLAKANCKEKQVVLCDTCKKLSTRCLSVHGQLNFEGFKTFTNIISILIKLGSKRVPQTTSKVDDCNTEMICNDRTQPGINTELQNKGNARCSTSNTGKTILKDNHCLIIEDPNINCSAYLSDEEDEVTAGIRSVMKRDIRNVAVNSNSGKLSTLYPLDGTFLENIKIFSFHPEETPLVTTQLNKDDDWINQFLDKQQLNQRKIAKISPYKSDIYNTWRTRASHVYVNNSTQLKVDSTSSFIRSALTEQRELWKVKEELLLKSMSKIYREYNLHKREKITQETKYILLKSKENYGLIDFKSSNFVTGNPDTNYQCGYDGADFINLILASLRTRESCRQAFQELKILTVVNLYILEAVTYVHLKSPDEVMTGAQQHDYNNRHAANYHLPAHRLAFTEKKPTYVGAKLWNALPLELKRRDQLQFGHKLKLWLQDHPFYTINEFLNRTF